MVLFDASLLHGVLPKLSSTGTDSGERLTMMVGFWGEDLQRAGPVCPTSPSFPCASMDITQHTSWQKEFENCSGQPVVAVKRVEEDETLRLLPRMYERVVPLHGSRTASGRDNDMDLEAEENAEERAVHFVDGYFLDDLDAVDDGLLKALVLNETTYTKALEDPGR